MGSVINNLVADIKIQQGKAQLKNTSFDIAEAKANLNASYAPTSTSSADFDISITAKDFDIQKVYNEVPIFKELVSMAQYAKGIASLDYQLKGILNDSMSPLYPSLKGGGEIRIKNAQLMNFKLMNAVSKATQRDSLTNPKVKDVVIKTKISNNIITLEKTKLKIFGFRPKFEGQVSFDGDLNLKARLGLPPFGIFGIPFHISGNSENPIIKLKRVKNVNTGLEEIVYEKDDENDEEIPAGKTLIDSTIVVPKIEIDTIQH
jgi:AsmA protein